MAALQLSGLRRLLDTPITNPGAVCQHCGAALSDDHAHVADVDARRLRCVCLRCHGALSAGAMATGEGGRQRVVPRRYLQLPGTAVGEAEWEAFEIPVGIAFFFQNSVLGRIVASYPSPAGAIESLLPPEAWESVIEASSWASTLTPDVEALLVRRTVEASDCFILPIDACYELSGRIRSRWRGFGGGPEVREEIDGFFRALAERSERVDA